MARSTVDARIGLLASRQAGVVSRAQALELGMTDAAMQRRVRSGRWVRRYPGVYAVAGAPRSWLHDIWCGLLAVGPAGVVTHETALRLHGVDGVRPRPLTFTVPHGGHTRLEGLFVHQIDDLRPQRVTTVANLPVSTTERVVVEMAAVVTEKRLGNLLDDVVAAKKVTTAGVAACLREVARPGKPGVAKLARVLDRRGTGYVPPHSVLERALRGALAAGGLPEPRRQFRLPGRGALDGLVDAAYPEARLIVEADGRRWHTRVRDLKRDHERDTEAARAGWQTLRFVWEQIVHSPGEVCAAIADVLLVRGASTTQPEAMVVGRRVPR